MGISKNVLDLKNPYFRYTGVAAQPPPGLNNTSPSESYWSTLDVQGARQAMNMVNGMSVNGLGEVSIDTSNTCGSSNLLATGEINSIIIIWEFVYVVFLFTVQKNYKFIKK